MGGSTMGSFRAPRRRTTIGRGWAVLRALAGGHVRVLFQLVLAALVGVTGLTVSAANPVSAAPGDVQTWTLPGAQTYPGSVVTGPDGRIWYGSLIRGEVGAFDPATQQFQTVTVPDSVQELTVGSDGNVWAAVNSGCCSPDQPNLLVAIAPSSMTVVKSVAIPIDGSGGPVMSVTSAPDGGLWVGTQRAHLLRVDPGASAVTASFDLPARVFNVKPDNSGHLLIAYMDIMSIGRFDPSTHALETFDVSSAFGPQGGTVNSAVEGTDGSIWFTDSNSGLPEFIGRLDPSSGAVSAIGGGGNINDPFSIIVGPDQAIWFGSGGFIGRVDPATSAIQTFAGNRAAYRITTGPDRNIWFSDQTGNAIGRLEMPAYLTVSQQPVAQTGTAGGTVTFEAAAIGEPTPTVQWEAEAPGGSTWVAVPGATDPSLVVSGLRVAQSGTLYRAVFTNAAGNRTTDAAALTVTPAPLTVVAPNQVVTYGSSFTLDPPTYVGLVNGDTAPATAPTCTTSATSASAPGNYPVVCSGAADPNYTIDYTQGNLTITSTSPTYTFNGFFQPINDPAGSNPSVFKDGSTVPVKFSLTDPATGALVPDATASAIASACRATFSATYQSAVTAPVDETSTTAPPTAGSCFRYDAGAHQFIFNWGTKGLTIGSYKLTATVFNSDGSTAATHSLFPVRLR